MKIYCKENQKGVYTKNNPNANYLVCGYGYKGTEVVRLDTAIKLAEKLAQDRCNYTDIRVHEFSTGETWYF